MQIRMEVKEQAEREGKNEEKRNQWGLKRKSCHFLNRQSSTAGTALPSRGTGIRRGSTRVGRLSFQQENSNEGFVVGQALRQPMAIKC